VCGYVCACVVYVCACVRACTCVHELCTCVCVRLCTNVCVCVVYLCMCACARTYVCVCVCVQVRVKEIKSPFLLVSFLPNIGPASQSKLLEALVTYKLVI